MISFLLLFALTACGNQNAENAHGNSDASSTTQSTGGNHEAEKSSSENPDETSGKKALIVYFSATGNTKEAAESIASAIGGDLFELVPLEPYRDDDLDWNNENSRVVYEHENPNERNIALAAATVDRFEEYDTVFIGYPKL